MNALEYNKYIDRIYDKFIKPLVDKEEMEKRKRSEESDELDDFDFDEEDEEEVIDDYNRRRSGKMPKWTGKGGGRYKRKNLKEVNLNEVNLKEVNLNEVNLNDVDLKETNQKRKANLKCVKLLKIIKYFY